jgi:hypothetical protein
MLDIKKILGRSWHILWAYKMLWVFGFMLALAAGGNDFRNSSNYSFGDGRNNGSGGIQNQGNWEGLHGDTFAELVEDGLRQARNGIQELREEYPVEFRMGVSAVITLIAMALVLGTIVAILRYVAETASIRMVDEYEASGIKVGFRKGWRYGWSPQAWRLFLVNFLVHLPVLALFVVLGLVAWWVFSALMGGVETTIISSIIAGSGLAFLSIFITVIVMAVLYVLRDFSWRMIVLEDAGVGASLRSATSLVRRQWKNVGLMWLVMVGLKIAWVIAFFILIIPLLVVSIFTAVGGLATAIVPTLVTAGIASLFSAPDYWPWIFAAIVGLPFFFVVTFSPILLVGGWAEIYQSSVWTLTYRELKALEAVEVEAEGNSEALPAEGDQTNAAS